MTKRLFVALALGLLLTGCDDPVREAKGNAIRRESEAQYMATATAVAIEEKAASVSIAATATAIHDEQVVMAATQAERIERQEATQKWLLRFGLAYVSVILLAFTIISIGGTTAASRKANLEANLIRIGKDTRTWPILLQGGYVINLETGERFKVSDIAPAQDRQLAISGRVRETGLLAQSAERIAKTTKNPQPADMLPAIAGNVPSLDWLPQLNQPTEAPPNERR